jgi:hypothetical protein
VNKPHRDVEKALIESGGKYRHDASVLDARRGVHLLPEATLQIGIGIRGRQELDCDLSRQGQILGLEYHPHPALSYLFAKAEPVV